MSAKFPRGGGGGAGPFLARSLFGRVIYHFTNFGFINAKINFLKKISVLSAVFNEFKYL